MKTLVGRYDIVTQSDVRDAVRRPEEMQNGHSLGHSATEQVQPQNPAKSDKSLAVLQ